MRCALSFPVKLMQCDCQSDVVPWAPDVPRLNWLKLSPFTNTSRPFRVSTPLRDVTSRPVLTYLALYIHSSWIR